MATVTTVDTQTHGAGTGAQSTPVALALQAATIRMAIQMLVTITRSATPTQALSTGFKQHTLYWASSPDDLSAVLVNVPTLLRHCTKSMNMILDKDIERSGQRQQVIDVVNGGYAYFWFASPASDDSAAIVVKVTEFAT